MLLVHYFSFLESFELQRISLLKLSFSDKLFSNSSLNGESGLIELVKLSLIKSIFWSSGDDWKGKLSFFDDSPNFNIKNKMIIIF